MPEPVKKSRLPGAAELFRQTGKAPSADPAPEPEPRTPTPTGRVRHDEKITVYFSSDELIALEDARLYLRRAHRLVVDRGRIVRAAVALALADLDEQGTGSALYGHLRQ